jgi:ABC-2 type transport system permease protein
MTTTPPSSGTFAPRPGAAPFPTQVLAQTRMETKLLLRNGEQLLLALVIPIIVLVGGVLAADRVGLEFPEGAIATLTPGVLALAVMSTSFTSLAIATGFERRYGVLKRLGASPLPRSGLLLGKVGSLLAVQTLQVLVIGTTAVMLGWSPAPGVQGVVGALLAVLLGTAAFASLGLALAGALRAEATLAAANLVYLLLMAGGAVVIPSSSYGAAGPLLVLLPSGALGDGLRAALMDGTVPVVPLLVLAAWAVLGTVLTARTFKWE